MPKFTKESLVSSYKSKNPDSKIGDDKIFYNIMKSNPKLKNYVEDYEQEMDKSILDYLPNAVKLGYNRSLTGQADELLSGKKRFDMSEYNPGTLEDLSATAIGLLMPTDAGPLGLASKAGATAFKVVYKGLVRSGVGKKIANDAVKRAVVNTGSGTGVFSAYSGLSNALRQQIDTGEIKIDELTEETVRGGIAGMVTGLTGGVLGAKGASSITKIAAETGALGSIGPILEGQMPTPDDYFHTAGVILGVKGGAKLFSSPNNIKNLFKKEPKKEIYKPSDEQAKLIATAEVKGYNDSMLTREKWVSPDLKGSSFGAVNIIGSTGKSYKLRDVKNDKYRNISKNNFHRLYNRSGKDLGSGTIRQSTEKEVRGYESFLGISKASAHKRREKYWSVEKEISGPQRPGVSKTQKSSFLKEANDGQLFEYKQRVKQEHDIIKETNRLQKEGIEIAVMPKNNFIDNYFPKQIAEMFESFKSPETLAKNPLNRKYIGEVHKYHGEKAELASSFTNQAIGEGIGKTPSRRELSKLGFRGKNAGDKYWENMSDRKESGELLEYNSLYNKVYKAAREAGVDVKGYVPNYLPKIIKPEIAEILFNDVQTLSSKMVGASKLLDINTNTKDWVKKNPEKAAELQSIIEKSTFSKEMQRTLKENFNPKRGTLLESFVDVGKSSFNDLYSVFGNLEKSRTLNLPKEYYERDFRKITQSYLYGGAKRIAEVKVFGRKGEKFNALKKGVASDGAFKEVEIMNEVQSHVVGSINKDPAYSLSPKGKKLAESVMAWETSTKIALGTATIPNMSQFMISSALDAGYFRFIRGIASLSSSKVRNAIEKSGATEFSMLNELLGTKQRTALGGKTADFLSKWSGFKGINKINQYTAAATARIFMKDLHKIANTSKIKLRREWANDKLNRMGLKSDKPFTEKDIIRGTNKYARDMNLQKDVTQDPLMMSNPRTQWFFQFKRFGYRQAKLMNNVIREDVKKGNVMSVVRLGLAGYAGGSGVSVAKKYYKEFLSGEPSFDPNADLPEDFEDLIEGISGVGALGMYGDFLSSAVSVAESPVKAMAFMASPPVLSSADNIMDFFLKLEKDSQTYGADVVSRLPSRVATLLGTVPSEIIKRIEPQGMAEERLEGKKSFAVRKINRYLDKGLFDKAYGYSESWNLTNPDNPISPRSISMRNVFKRMLEREKKKSKNKLRLPEF